MASPTIGDVHVPTAIGNKKGRPKMAGKQVMDDSGDEQEMGKKARMGGKVPPQFLPKQKGKGEPDADDMGKMGKPKMASAGGGRGAKTPAARGGKAGAGRGGKAGVGREKSKTRAKR